VLNYQDFWSLVALLGRFVGFGSFFGLCGAGGILSIRFKTSSRLGDSAFSAI
jgi:hypothetical protein